MSRDASITLPFADGDYVFRLAWGDLAKLQESRDAGPYVILTRLQTYEWHVEDISEVIRLGLIGGGLAPVKALQLTRSYVEARPPIENLPTAILVLGTAVIGNKDEVVGKKEEAASPETTESDSTISQTGS